MQRLWQYAELTDAELAELNKGKTIILLPVSLLEAHGPHLPLGTDFFMATHLANALGHALTERYNNFSALVLPTIPLGAGGIDRPGTITHDKNLVRETIVQMGQQLANNGFGKGIIVSGHAGEKHLQAMAEAADALQKTGAAHFFPLTSFLFSEEGMKRIGKALKRQQTENPRDALPAYDGHAGCWETSLALHFFGEAVRDTYKSLPVSEDATLNGYRGKPAQAQKKLGKALAHFLIALALEIIEEQLQLATD